MTFMAGHAIEPRPRLDRRLSGETGVYLDTPQVRGPATLSPRPAGRQTGWRAKSEQQRAESRQAMSGTAMTRRSAGAGPVALVRAAGFAGLTLAGIALLLAVVSPVVLVALGFGRLIQLWLREAS